MEIQPLSRIRALSSQVVRGETYKEDPARVGAASYESFIGFAVVAPAAAAGRDENSCDWRLIKF